MQLICTNQCNSRNFELHLVAIILHCELEGLWYSGVGLSENAKCGCCWLSENAALVDHAGGGYRLHIAAEIAPVGVIKQVFKVFYLDQLLHII